MKEYASYIIFYNEIREAMKDSKLERKKVEIEEMHFELKQKFQSYVVETADTVTLEDIQEQFLKIQTSVADAEEEIKNKKAEMNLKFEADVARLAKDNKTAA